MKKVLTTALKILVFTLIGAHLLLHIAIHEFGHFVFGKLTGHTLSHVRLGKFLWYKENGKWKYKSDSAFVKQTKAVGQCWMLPPAGCAHSYNFFLYVFGGGLFNFITAMVLLAVLIVGNTSGFVMGLIIYHFVISLYLAIANLTIGGDGRQIREGLKSPTARRGQYWTFYVGRIGDGASTSFKDFTAEDFHIDDNVEIKYQSEILLLMWDTARLTELKQYDLIVERYHRIANSNIKGQKTMSPLLRHFELKALYACIVHLQDYEKAKEIYAQEHVQKELETNTATTNRVLAAYNHYVLDDAEKVNFHLEKANIIADEWNNTTEKLYIKELEELIAPSTQG